MTIFWMTSAGNKPVLVLNGVEIFRVFLQNRKVYPLALHPLVCTHVDSVVSCHATTWTRILSFNLVNLIWQPRCGKFAKGKFHTDGNPTRLPCMPGYLWKCGTQECWRAAGSANFGRRASLNYLIMLTLKRLFWWKESDSDTTLTSGGINLGHVTCPLAKFGKSGQWHAA